MRDYQKETENRVAFLKDVLLKTHAKGFVFGNSGGKDSALVGILCKMACDNTVGIIMPCESKQNYGSDKDDGLRVAEQYHIENLVLDLTEAKQFYRRALAPLTTLPDQAAVNINPRLRMTALYAYAQSNGLLVAGTGNRSEYYMGYFTKWGDGGYDVNPIRDLTATEVFEFLRYLKAPMSIIEKAPSAGLYEGQTDEKDMGVTYAAIDRYIQTGEANEADKAIIDRYHMVSGHKRTGALVYGETEE